MADDTATDPPQEMTLAEALRAVEGLRSDLGRERKKREALEQTAEAAKAKLTAAETAKAEAEGNWRALAEQRDTRIKELEATIATDRARGTFRDTVGQAAKALGFRDAADAEAHLAMAGVDVTADAKTIKAALEGVAKDRPYLVADKADDPGKDPGKAPATSGGLSGILGRPAPPPPFARSGAPADPVAEHAADRSEMATAMRDAMLGRGAGRTP